MRGDIDSLTRELQQRMDESARQKYGDKVYELWQKPRHMGALAGPHCQGQATGSCGDTMQIFLRFQGEKVEGAGFMTDGCGSSTVAGSAAAELALGRTFDELGDIDGQTILDFLGGLPEEDRHCAHLAARALHEAIEKHAGKSA